VGDTVGDIRWNHFIVNVWEEGKEKGIAVSPTDKRNGKGMWKTEKR
jgi:hypothetical protein